MEEPDDGTGPGAVWRCVDALEGRWPAEGDWIDGFAHNENTGYESDVGLADDESVLQGPDYRQLPSPTPTMGHDQDADDEMDFE